jgi:hypothetical protein
MGPIKEIQHFCLTKGCPLTKIFTNLTDQLFQLFNDVTGAWTIATQFPTDNPNDIKTQTLELG